MMHNATPNSPVLTEQSPTTHFYVWVHGNHRLKRKNVDWNVFPSPRDNAGSR